MKLNVHTQGIFGACLVLLEGILVCKARLRRNLRYSFRLVTVKARWVKWLFKLYCIMFTYVYILCLHDLNILWVCWFGLWSIIYVELSIEIPFDCRSVRIRISIVLFLWFLCYTGSTSTTLCGMPEATVDVNSPDEEGGAGETFVCCTHCPMVRRGHEYGTRAYPGDEGGSLLVLGILFGYA